MLDIYFLKFRILFLILIFFIVYQKNTTAQFQNTTGFVSEEQTVNGFSNTYLGVDFAEPYIASNPRDPLNSICAFSFGVYLTQDGLNWNKLNTPQGSDSFLTFDSLGNMYYAELDFNGRYLLKKSTNKGNSWSLDYILAPQADKECIYANKSGGPYSNFVFSSWANMYTTDYARSTNQGVNWSIVNLGNIGYPTYIVTGPSSSVSGGIMYLCYHLYENYLMHVKLRRSYDGGLTFTPEILVSDFMPAPLLKNDSILATHFNQMSADNSFGPYRGNVYIVFTGRGLGIDKANIYLTKSTNYGDNWSVPVKLNDDNSTTDQWMPALTVDDNGKIYVAWYDSRIDELNNRMTLLYGTVSTDGGNSFVPYFPVSTTPFSPASMAQHLYGLSYYMGHYIGSSAVNNTAIVAWADGRNKNLGSYVGYFPDFALKCYPEYRNLLSNDSVIITANVPAVKGPFNRQINFTASIDTMPSSGNIFISFLNGKDFITNIPDSVKVIVKTIGSVTPRLYRLYIIARSIDGVPVHRREIKLPINYSFLSVGTNRNKIAQFKVNGVLYDSTRQFSFPNNSQINVQAISPRIISNTQYVYTNWSDEGDTSHNIILNNSYINLTAFYKVQFMVHIASYPNTTFGGDIYLDSGSVFNFGVVSRRIVYNGTTYDFRGWTGSGAGSYTSPDSSGVDSVISLSLTNSVNETPRWKSTTGIIGISSEIPLENKLFNNYPNPFNPTTTIKFQIKDAKLTIIKIYDLLGREVKTLVNEKLMPGRYNIVFNGSDLSSGVYFYRIVSGNFSDVKKMLVIK